MSDLRHFTREEIMAVDPAHVADAMAAALGMVSRGAAVAPIRAHIDLGGGAGTFLISGVLNELDLLTVKVINVRPQNPSRGLERLQGSLTVFESSTGLPLATMDARAATEARTSACSANGSCAARYRALVDRNARRGSVEHENLVRTAVARRITGHDDVIAIGGDIAREDFFRIEPVSAFGFRIGVALEHDQRDSAGRICCCKKRRWTERAAEHEEDRFAAPEVVQHRGDAVGPLLQGRQRVRRDRIGRSHARLVEEDEPTKRCHRLDPPSHGG